MKKLRKISMRSLIKKNKFLIINLVLILLIMLILGVILNGSYKHICFSINFFIESLKLYFCAVFRIDCSNEVYTIFDYVIDLNSGNIASPFLNSVEYYLPVNFSDFTIYIKAGWYTFWNLDNFKNSFNFIFAFLDYFNLIFLIIVLTYVIFVTIDSLYFSERPINVVGFTRGSNLYFKINKVFLHKIKMFILALHEWNKLHKIYLILTIIFLFNFDFISIFIDVFSYILLFLSSFNFVILYECLFSSLYCFISSLSYLPLWLILILGYIFFDKYRCKKALNKLMILDYKNRDFIQNRTGVVNIVKGAPGVGKTLLLTDLGRTAEQLFRYNLLDNLNQFQSYFPEFDFKYFEEYIKYLRINNICNNHSQIENLINDRRDRFFRLLVNHLASYDHLKKYIFGYDYIHLKNRYFNGIYWIDFFDFLIVYGQSYFYYICSKPVLYSNYSIRVDCLMYSLDYFPLWSYDYFTINKYDIDERSHFCHIIDMDSLRLGKKFNKDTTVLGFGVLCFTEFDKERGNQLSNTKFKKDSFYPNPLNDELTKYLKLSRQVATINYKPFFKMFTDMQRVGDISLANVEISECVIKIKEKQRKTSLFLFYIEPLICNILINFYNNFLNRYRSSRNYFSFFYLFINFLFNPVKHYLERRENIYGYSKLCLEINLGDDESDKIISFYYLIDKKALAKTYSTDTHYGFFKESMDKEKTSINDKPCYEGLRASSSEIKAQNSFLGQDLANSFEGDNRGDFYE